MAEKRTPNMLNLTLPLKQDAVSQATLAALEKSAFATNLFPAVEAALKKSQMVHFARFTLIKTKESYDYLQVLTEYDNDLKEYTLWFATELKEVFRKVFALVEGALPDEDVGNPDKLHDYIQRHDLPLLGGKAFSAYGALTVTEIQKKFDLT